MELSEIFWNPLDDTFHIPKCILHFYESHPFSITLFGLNSLVQKWSRNIMFFCPTTGGDEKCAFRTVRSTRTRSYMRSPVWGLSMLERLPTSIHRIRAHSIKKPLMLTADVHCTLDAICDQRSLIMILYIKSVFVTKKENCPQNIKNLICKTAYNVRTILYIQH